MSVEAIKIQTNAALLKKLQSAPNPSRRDLREQRISFAIGSSDQRNSMTREEVRQLIERKG